MRSDPKDRDDPYLSESENQVVLWRFKLDAVQVTHRNVDGTDMNPPSVGMERQPLRQKPIVMSDSIEIGLIDRYAP